MQRSWPFGLMIIEPTACGAPVKTCYCSVVVDRGLRSESIKLNPGYGGKKRQYRPQT